MDLNEESDKAESMDIDDEDDSDKRVIAEKNNKRMKLDGQVPQEQSVQKQLRLTTESDDEERSPREHNLKCTKPTEAAIAKGNEIMKTLAQIKLKE